MPKKKPGPARLDPQGQKRERRQSLFATDDEWAALGCLARELRTSWSDALLRSAGLRAAPDEEG